MTRSSIRKGFSLVELMIVLLIMGILVASAAGYYGENAKQARMARAHQDMDAIRIAIKNYAAHTGKYPTSLNEIVGKYIEAIPQTPWGDLYEIEGKVIWCYPGSKDARRIEVQFAP
jgi:general secretion pathway protein G